MTESLNRKTMKFFLIITLLAAAIFPGSVFAATGDTLSIEFDSTTKVELVVGQTPKQLKVLATLEGSSTKKDVTGSVAWTTSNSGAVKVNAGLLTPVDSGTAVITAAYNSAVTTIEVSVSHPFSKLQLDYSSAGQFKLGDNESILTVTANATGGQSTTSVNDVTASAEWSSSNGSVLTVSKGKLTLVGEGSATVTAKYKGLTESFKAVVASPYSSIAIKKEDGTLLKELELLVGETPKVKALTKAISSSDGVNATAEAEWTSSNTSVATVNNGEIKAIATGKTIITVKYLGVSASLDVYVRAPYEALILTPSGNHSVFMNEVIKVTAEVRDGINSNKQVASLADWSSSNQLIATIANDGDHKMVTAKSPGTSNVKAEYLGLNKEIKFTVYPTLIDLVPERKEMELYTSDSISLPKVNGTKLDDSKIDISDEIEWSSADESVAKIKDGKIVAGSTAGTVNLTGKIKDTEIAAGKSSIRNKTFELKIMVKEKVLILLGPDGPIGIVIGEEQPLPEINAVMESGEENDVSDSIEWSLSGSNAVIKQTAKGKVIKGLVKGSATLKGTYNNKTISIPVKIEQKVVKLVVEPAAVELNLKGSKAIKVTGYFSDGKSANFSSTINWSSSNTAVATVKGTTVKAVSVGTSTLSGSYQGIAVSVKVSVVPKLIKLNLNDTRFTLAPGATATAVLTAQYDTGNTSIVTGSAVWTSSKTSVAKVSSNGVITAVSKGTASIKGKIGTKTVTISVTVK